MKTTYILLIGLCLMGLFIRTCYELLKRAGRVDPKSKAVFPVVFIGMCMMLLSWPFLCILDPIQQTLPATIRWAGLLGIAFGLGLAVGGLIQLKGLENIDHLVTNGLFARIRHPMYTGFILWISGWVIYQGATLSFFIWLVSIANILYWRRIEERKLEVQFGEEYFRYKKSTWF
jgi:protein-S-isoprenylcysteine O-methyltransferase Ste14